MIRKLKSKTVPLTKELAERFAGMKKSFCERPLDEKHIKWLVQEMTPFPFRDFVWATVVLNGIEHRVNGQHTSTMFALGYMDIPADAQVRLEKFSCDTAQEVTECWQHYDAIEETRTRGQLVDSWRGTDPQLTEVPSRVVKQAIAGIAMANGRRESQADGRRSIGQVMFDNKDFILFTRRVSDCSSSTKGHGAVSFSKCMTRASVQAAIYLTMKKDIVASEQFWTAVKDGSGAEPSNPTRVLREYLMTTFIKGGMTLDTRKQETAVVMMSKCLVCWNHWRRGNRMAMIRLPLDGRIPEIV